MSKAAPHRQALLEQVLKAEWEMFQTVNAVSRASCQDDPDSFAVMRGAQFAAWSDATLESYLLDLNQAVGQGKNLMTLKYARMDGLVPRLNSSPLVERIVEVQTRWQQELSKEFPLVLGRGRGVTDEQANSGTSFARYLAGELETYSERTLALLWQDMEAHLKANTNGARQVYTAMVKALGYEDLADAERSLASR
ncbi:MAG: DUF4125 family protein [Desulfatibacillaceae bacterium]|nr:DUF4125 family protein [Desulfatibacillaceae bacterium]